MHFVLFGCIWDNLLRYNTQFKTGQTGAKVRAMKSFRNFSQRTHAIHPFGPLPHVSVHFVLFGCIWDSLLRYNTQFKTGQTGAKVRATMSRRNFSQRTHPIHPMGLESHVLVCFVRFGCIWYRLVALQNSVQNGPKWCKSSCHEVVSGAQSSPLGQKLMFHSVSYYFGTFGTVRLCYKTQCKTDQTDAKVRATKSRRNFSQRTHPIHPIGLQTHVLV